MLYENLSMADEVRPELRSAAKAQGFESSRARQIYSKLMIYFGPLRGLRGADGLPMSATADRTTGGRPRGA